MIFVTTLCIGLAAGLSRSAVSVMFSAVALIVTLGLAAFAAGTLSVAGFAMAMAGYNCGLILYVLMLLGGAPAMQGNSRNP